MTECSFPPPPTDDELALILDGFADDAVRQHLERCPFCTGRLNKLREFDNRLQGLLIRFECPSPQRLGDYHAGILDAADAEAVREHLATCPACQKDVAMLVKFLNQLDESAEPDNIIPFAAPRKAWRTARAMTIGNLALKGGDSDDETTHDAESGSASVFLESKPVAKGYLLTGQVLDAEVNWSGAIAEIWRDNVIQQVRILDEQGEFSFELATPVSVDLYITATGGAALVVKNITIQT